MHVFIWEALTAGAWPEQPLPESLLREGRAMLTALVEDVLRIDDCRVSTIRHFAHKLPSPESGRLAIHQCGAMNEESALFQELAGKADFCWIIAPETGGLLADRCRLVEAFGRRLAGPSSTAVEVCGDKLLTAQRLQAAGIPTIDTVAVESAMIPERLKFPAVVKLRVGAGSEGCRQIRTPADWPAAASGAASAPRSVGATGKLTHPARLIVQPFIAGTPLSVAALIGSDGTPSEFLPIARQRLADDGTFTYLGGEIPAGCDRTDEIHGRITSACAAVPGLLGYVGFDLIVPDDERQPAVLVEINPRLTTSYVGYRRLTPDNIAERVLFPQRNRPPVSWRSATVWFTPDGQFTIRE